MVRALLCCLASTWLFAASSARALDAGRERDRLLVMDLVAGQGVSRDTAATFTDLATAYLSRAEAVLVVSRRDIERIADLEAKKQQAGCESSDACMAELGGALGARYVLFGRIGKLGGSTFVHTTLLDVETGQPLKRQVVQAAALDELAQRLDAAMGELVPLLSRAPAARPPSRLRAVDAAPPVPESRPPPSREGERPVVEGGGGRVAPEAERRIRAEQGPAVSRLRRARLQRRADALREEARGKYLAGSALSVGGLALGTAGLVGSLVCLSSPAPQSPVPMLGGVLGSGLCAAAGIGFGGWQIASGRALDEEADAIDGARGAAMAY